MKSGVLIIIVVLAIILFVGGFVLFGSFNSNSGSSSSSGITPNSENSEPSQPVNPDNSKESNTITITSSGFSPSTLNVNIGDRVTFTNLGSSQSWPASNIHPTHTVYPGSGISKCDGAEESNIFDACRGLRQGESYSFTFNEAGSWKYHDHLNPGSGGTIIVG